MEAILLEAAGGARAAAAAGGEAATGAEAATAHSVAAMGAAAAGTVATEALQYRLQLPEAFPLRLDLFCDMRCQSDRL